MKVKISIDPASLQNIATFFLYMSGNGWGNPESFDKPLDVIYVVGPGHTVQGALGQSTIIQSVAQVCQQAGVGGKIMVLP